MRTPRLNVALAALLAFGSIAPQGLWAKAEKSAFEKAVAAARKDPENRELRKKVIRLAQDEKDLPEVPEEVAVLKGKTAYVMKNATSPKDFLPAVEACREATLLAPWVGGLYYNLGVVEERAELPEDAIEDFKLYLLANPDAEDRPKVLERLGRLQVKLDEKVAATEAAQTRRQNDAETAVARKAWQGKKSGQTVVLVLSGITLGVGAVMWGAGLGGQSGAVAKTKPGVYSGVLYNIAVDGSYYSSASYAEYKSGQDLANSGILVGCIGLGGLVVGLLMDPGPEPRSASLIDLQGDKLALNWPAVGLDAQGGVQGQLLHASF